MQSLIFASLAFIAMIFACWVIWSQQRTIDRLTDKLMARDYKEYTTLNAPVAPPKPQKEPMSWYDDPQDEDDSAH